MKNIKSTICILLALVFITGCNARTPEEAQRIRDQAHEREMARITMGQNYQSGHYNDHSNSFSENMAIAATAGFVFSAFQPRYEPSFRGGSYYDRDNRVITRTVYETRVRTVELDKKQYKSKKANSFKKWKSKPSNAKKMKSSKKVADKKTGSITAAKSKWAGNSGKNSGWAKSKPKQNRMTKKPKPKAKPRLAKKPYSSSKKKYR